MAKTGQCKRIEENIRGENGAKN